MTEAIDPGTTTEGLPTPDATQAEPQAQATGQESQPTLQDRIRNDPEFAWEQTTKRDATISELSNKVKQYETVDPYIRAAGGPEQLLNLAAFGQQVQGVPGLQDFVQKSISEGRVALPEEPKPDDPAEDWMDEDTKRVRDEFRQEMAQIRQEFQGLQSMAATASVRSQATHVRENIEEVSNLFENTPEGREEALSLIEQRVSNAQRQAEEGNPAQQAMIDQLAGPKGADVLKYMLMEEGLFDKYGAQIYGARTTTNDDEAAKALAKSTDGRVVNASRPGTPELPPVPKGPVGTQTYQLIYEALQRKRGRAA